MHVHVHDFIVYSTICIIMSPCCVLTEIPSEVRSPLSSQRVIIGISLAVVIGVVLAIAGIIVVIVILRRRSERKHVIATGTFDNASPPVKRHKKPHSNDLDYVDAHNDVFDVPTSPPSIALTMLTYSHEPCPPGTPPPPEPTSFQAASSPLSTNSPPSYSDLEDVPPTNSGFTNQIPSCGPPHENTDTQLSIEDIHAPLKMQYSVEPRAAGHSPTPPSTTDGREDTKGQT